MTGEGAFIAETDLKRNNIDSQDAKRDLLEDDQI